MTHHSDKSEQEHDEDGIRVLATGMRNKLGQQRALGKHGWWDARECDVETLAALFVEQLGDADIVNLSNFLMMLYNRTNGRKALRAALKGVGRLVPL